MKAGKRAERQAITAVERLAGLTPRRGRGKGFHGGRFVYVTRDARNKPRVVNFEWDGAATDQGGRLVVLEAELDPGLNAGHLQGHLTRLPLMARCGDVVSKVIWIVRRASRRRLVEIVDTWIAHYGPLFQGAMPEMEVRAPDGEVMPWWIDRTAVTTRRS
jgi:hypothetical protein